MLSMMIRFWYPFLVFHALFVKSALAYSSQCNKINNRITKTSSDTSEGGASLLVKTTTNRRQWLSAASAAAFLTVASSASPNPALAAELKTYNDPVHEFSVSVPSSWVATEQEMPDRRVIKVWTDPTDAKGQTLLFVAYTSIRDDFTSLGSFGSVEEVASTTILPKGQMMGVDVSSEMLSAENKKSAYFFDYKQEVPGVQPPTHFRTIFTLTQGATGGAGAILVTITLQTPEARYTGSEGLKPVFNAVIDSYEKTKKS